MADSNPVYYAARFQKPRLKWSWFSDKMDGHIEKQHWLRGDLSIVGHTGIQVPPLPPHLYRPGDQFGGLKAHQAIRNRLSQAIDFFDEYSAHNICETDSLMYWNKRYNSQPDLARMG
ncbi:hypothetical protein M501DRAFT_989652 [Patellaria atrata CBS 101060]|uniref:Uncharacterized protein n=1 Tax=Patellaria atrata CBS 101060 TaxID=1346257 RepID=A0A9P4S1D3_9PEZI|nr:hypothetical protein M501DRAFT_989652 [Patellaria atrata CBS 101060]